MSWNAVSIGEGCHENVPPEVVWELFHFILPVYKVLAGTDFG